MQRPGVDLAQGLHSGRPWRLNSCKNYKAKISGLGVTSCERVRHFGSKWFNCAALTGTEATRGSSSISTCKSHNQPPHVTLHHFPSAQRLNVCAWVPEPPLTNRKSQQDQSDELRQCDSPKTRHMRSICTERLFRVDIKPPEHDGLSAAHQAAAPVTELTATSGNKTSSCLNSCESRLPNLGYCLINKPSGFYATRT